MNAFFPELPIAVERQWEDLQIQREFNRNPRVHAPTKVDKVRSEMIINKNGAARDVDIKAKVVNKIVREASGVHQYAIVPPPRRGKKTIPLDPDPETNPLVKLYAKETKKKPVIVSYGHRPSSASRTFNPGTMKIHMRHDEAVSAPQNNTFNFGLPAGILQKILKAPSIKGNPFGENEQENVEPKNAVYLEETKRKHSGAKSEARVRDVREQNMFSNGVDASTTDSMNSGGTLPPLSSTLMYSQLRNELGKSHFGEQLEKNKRVPWDTAHNVISPLMRKKEIYALKANHMNDSMLTLKEKLTRYHKKTTADTMSPFCPEKQLNDVIVARNQRIPDRLKSSSAYRDPLNTQLHLVKIRRKEDMARYQRVRRAKEFQSSITEIPKVAYHPHSLNTQLRSGQTTMNDITKIANQAPQYWYHGDFYDMNHHEDDASVGSQKSEQASVLTTLSPLVKFDEAGNPLPEGELYSAMKDAKLRGNERALFDLFFKSDDPHGDM
jgi:predicted kinase